MKLLSQRTNKDGKRVATVELRDDETLMAFRQDGYYRLGGQVEDVVGGHVVTESCPVMWCSIEQGWVS